MGAHLQMPYAGYLNVEHRRLRPDRKVDNVAWKTSANHIDFGCYKPTVVGKADGSVMWHLAQSNGVRGWGIWRQENPYDDQGFVYKETWCSHTASNEGGSSGVSQGFIDPITQIPVLLDDSTYGGLDVHSPCYVPTTNELWFVASAYVDPFVGAPTDAVGYTHILRCNADSPPSSSTLVLAEPGGYWYNFFSGTTADEYTLVSLRYDHVRDCVWAYYKNCYSTFENDSGQFSDIIHHGHLSLRKYSTSGALLSEEILTEWSNLYWRDSAASEAGMPFVYGIQPWFSVGDDGLLWYTTYYTSEWVQETSGFPSDASPPTFGGGAFDAQGDHMRLLRSYNPDTGAYASYPNHWFSTDCPGIMDNGELLLWQADQPSRGQWWAFDPATDTKVSVGNPGWISTGQGYKFYEGCSTVVDSDGTHRIFAVENATLSYGSDILQFMPGAYGLTVVSADWTRFDHPWETTTTPIYNTIYGEVHEATYGPFQKGDLIRFGCLLQEKASGQDKPSENDLCIITQNVTSSTYAIYYSIDGENQGALWEYNEDDGSIMITWGHYFLPYGGYTILPSAETIVRMSLSDTAVEISPDIVDTTIRIVTLDEVVPIRYDQPVGAVPAGVGCPPDNAGLSLKSWPPAPY